MYQFNFFTYDIFFERDISRALLENANFFKYGPEVYGGGNTPGFLYNLLLFLVNTVSFGNIPVFYFIFYCMFYAGLIAIVEVQKSSNLVKIFLLLVLSSMVITQEVVSTLWNPTFVFPFCCFFYISLIKFNENIKLSYLLLSSGLIAICSSAHISYWILNIPLFYILGIRRKSINNWAWALPIIVQGIFLAPFLFFLLNNFGSHDLEMINRSSYNVPSLAVENCLQVLKNFLGIIFPLGELGIQWRKRLVLEGYLVIFYVLSSIGIYLFSFKHFHFLFKKKCAFFILLLSLVIFLISFYSYSNHEVNLRRYLWVLPLFYLCIGRILSHAILTDRKKILASIFFFCIANYSYGIRNNLQFPVLESHRLKMDIFENLRSKFKLNSKDIVHKVGLMYLESESIEFLSLDGISFSMMQGQDEFSTQYLNYMGEEKDCYLVLIREESESKLGKTNTWFELLRKDLLGASFHQIELIEHGDFDYISYQSESGNCYTSFKNYYFIKNLIYKEQDKVHVKLEHDFYVTVKQIHDKLRLDYYSINYVYDLVSSEHESISLELFNIETQEKSTYKLDKTPILGMSFIAPIFFDLSMLARGVYNVSLRTTEKVFFLSQIKLL